MTAPVIPSVTQEQALADLLESVALEEVAIAHFINAEAEKIQAIGALLEGNQMDLSTVIDFERSVAGVLQTAIKMQMLLEFKLEDVLNAKRELEPGTTPPAPA